MHRLKKVDDLGGTSGRRRGDWPRWLLCSDGLCDSDFEEPVNISRELVTIFGEHVENFAEFLELASVLQFGRAQERREILGQSVGARQQTMDETDDVERGVWASEESFAEQEFGERQVWRGQSQLGIDESVHV